MSMRQRGTDGGGWMVSIPFASTSELWKEVGNAVWLFIGLTDLVTREFECFGIRVGEVLGGARVCDELISGRLCVAFRPLTIRKWRRRLIKAGLIIQRRIPAGLQIAVIGTRKFRQKPSGGAPAWIANHVAKLVEGIDPDGSDKATQIGRSKRPSGVDISDPLGSEQLRPFTEDSNRETPPNPQRGLSARFQRFWNAYPRKVGKGTAERAFNRIKPDDNLVSKMLVAIQRWKQSDAWAREGGRFVPYPATWLKRRGWEDELPANDDMGWR